MSNANANTDSQSLQNHADRSQWPIDHVPPPILDSIVDALARFAQEEIPSRYYEDTTMFFPMSAWVPFSAELQAMSLTCKTFRANIFSRKITFHVLLRTPEQGHYVNSTMTPERRSYVRSLTCLDPDNYDFITTGRHCNEFIASLHNLQAFRDERTRGRQLPTPFPAYLWRISVISGDWKPLGTQHLDLLHIEPNVNDAFEQPLDGYEAKDFRDWPVRLGILCAKIRTIDQLHLVLPDMSPCSCVECRLAIVPNVVLADFLSQQPPLLKVLHVETPWCCADPGSLRYVHWRGYLGWLTQTSGRFETLVVTGHWQMTYLSSGPETSRSDIQESLGLARDRFGTEFYAWLRAVFSRVKELHTISLISTYTGPGTEERRSPMRKTTFRRPQFEGACEPRGADEILLDVEKLVSCIKSTVGSGSFEPVHVTGRRPWLQNLDGWNL